MIRRIIKHIFLISISLFTIMFIYLISSTNVKASSIPEIIVENKVDSDAIHRGQSFKIKVDLKNNASLISLKIAIEYDKDIFTLVNVERGTALNDLTLTTTNINTEAGYSITPFNILWDGRESDSSNGTLLFLTFETNITTEVGIYPINVTYDQSNTKSGYGIEQEVNIYGGNIELVTGQYSVRYQDYNLNILFEKDYNGNELPVYNGSIPVREEDEKYSYEFKKWVTILSDDPNLIIYEASYTKTPIRYQVFMYVNEELIDAIPCNYGEYPIIPKEPIIENYSFIGWYIDKDFKTPYYNVTMEANDLSLYGLYKYNIREKDIPVIILQTEDIVNNEVNVLVTLDVNTGLSGLVLTLDYDMDALELIDFTEGITLEEAQFDYTNIENISSEKNFRFYWESTKNMYNTGLILTLKFKIKSNAKKGSHHVNLIYDYYNHKSEATFITEDNNIWYTLLEIKNTSIPIGTINHWHDIINDEKSEIDITSDKFFPINVILQVTPIIDSINLTEEEIFNIAGDNMILMAAYDIKLLQNNYEINIDDDLTIKIKLTEEQKKCKNIQLYCLDSENNISSYEYFIEDGNIVFITNDLTNDWLIIGDNVTSWISNTSIIITIIMFVMLVCALVSYILILLSKYRKNEKNMK